MLCKQKRISNCILLLLVFAEHQKGGMTLLRLYSTMYSSHIRPLHLQLCLYLYLSSCYWCICTCICFFVFASDNSVAIIFLLCIRVTSDQLPLSPLNNPFYILIRIPKGGDSDLRMLIGLLACLIFVTGTTGGACVNKFCLV